MTTKFPGVHCVVYALFDEREQLDRGAMRAQFEIALALGVDGVTLLGLATEVQKLTLDERKTLIDWASKDIAQRVPLSVTISGNSVAEQAHLAQFSQDAGADWLILQPPSVGTYGADAYIDFFARVADRTCLPLAVQNAPHYLGRSLSATDIKTLVSRNGNFTHLKAETAAVDLASLIAHTDDKMTVLSGRGGLEITDSLRAGCEGFVVAPDAIDKTKRIYDLWMHHDVEKAEDLYAAALPAMTFTMQSLEQLACYGKRIFGHRANIDIHDRAPSLMPSAFGLQAASYWAEELGPFPAA